MKINRTIEERYALQYNDEYAFKSIGIIPISYLLSKPGLIYYFLLK